VIASASRRRLDWLALALALALASAGLAACAQPAAPSPEPDARPPSATSTRGGATASAADGAATPPPTATASASAPMAAPSASAAPAAPEDPRNVTKPEDSAGPALQARAKALFDGVVADDPALAEPFWFPREPFTRLKAIDKPERYWAQLHAAYEADVHKLHRSRKSWEGARFVGYESGSAPTWVKPGDEGNSIGYWRSFRGKVRFEQGGKEESFEVRVTITWQGAWHITHLLPFKK